MSIKVWLICDEPNFKVNVELPALPPIGSKITLTNIPKPGRRDIFEVTGIEFDVSPEQSYVEVNLKYDTY